VWPLAVRAQEGAKAETATSDLYHLIHLGSAVTIFAATYAFFQRLEDNCSKEFRDDVSQWLLNTTMSSEAVTKWPKYFIKLFDLTFGDRHFTATCFRRSCIATLCSLVIVFAANFSNWQPFESFFGDYGLEAWHFIPLFFTNFLFDYFSLLKSRYLLQKMTSMSLLSSCLLLIADYIVTIFGYVILVAFFISMISPRLWSPHGCEDVLVPDSDTLCLAQYLLSYLGESGSALDLLVYSSLFTTVWATLYVASTSILRSIIHTKAFEVGRRVLDVKDHAIRSIGLIAGLLFGFSAWLLSWL
jgi:hypothetical protein